MGWSLRHTVSLIVGILLVASYGRTQSARPREAVQARAEADRGPDSDSNVKPARRNSVHKAQAARAQRQRYSQTGDTCTPICSRLDECQVMDYGNCLKICRSNDDDPTENMQQAKWSCQRLSAHFNGNRGDGSGVYGRGRDSGSGDWSCRAVGTYVGAYNGSPDYGNPINVDVTKFGRTRDVAGVAAIDACSGMLNLGSNSAISPGSLVTEYCRVLSCSR